MCLDDHAESFSEEAKKLWGEKCTFFWYNAPQIFQWKQNDFDEQARKFHDAGITSVITFSVTHFRRSFIPWHDQILKAIRRICTACHRYGISVEEHHSCCLGWLPDTQEKLKCLINYMAKHESSLEDFPGLVNYLCSDYDVKGTHVSSMRQITGRTGKMAPTQYHGDAVCFNNPDYRKGYHAYVDELKSAGVDSILADDMQFFDFGNACTCKYCREKFFKETGFTLPPPEEWNHFYGDFDNPVFLEWLRFRVRTTHNFQQELRDHYRSIGLADHWLNYRSSLLCRDTTANAFTSCRTFWSITFQENCLSQLLRVSWPFFHDESMIQFSMGEIRNAPSMSLFYPTKYDQYYFSWALAMSWGQIPFLCPEGGNLIELDRFFNMYSNAHPELFRQVKKIPEISFLTSRESFDFTEDWENKVYHPLHGMLQAAYFNNLQANAIGEESPVEYFLQQKLIAAVGVRLVTPELLDKLFTYVTHGGKLVVFNGFAECFPPTGLEKLLSHPNVIRDYTVLDPELDQSDMWISRMCSTADGKVESVANVYRKVRDTYGPVLKQHIGEKTLVRMVPEDYLCTVYRSNFAANTCLAHLIHISGILPPSRTLVSHEDSISNFEEDSAKNKFALQIGLYLSGIRRVVLYSPELKTPVPLTFHITDNGTAELTIPENTFAGYAILKIES